MGFFRLPEKFEWMKFLGAGYIPNNSGQWYSSLFGTVVYAIWNEMDYYSCSTNETKVEDKSQSVELSFKFPIEKVGSIGGAWNTSYSESHKFIISVKGNQVVPMGYNAMPYCENDWNSNLLNLCMPECYYGIDYHLYPSGPNQMQVSFGAPWIWNSFDNE